MLENELRDEYFAWLCRFVTNQDAAYSEYISYDKLLRYLHGIEFTWTIKKDKNRANDGIDLRSRFSNENGFGDISDILNGPCSVLEMMIALALRCEETIMDDPLYGNRTRQWFWGMVVSLGLGSMADSIFDEDYVDEVVRRFLNRKYKFDGRGGLFTIKNCELDIRRMEIWKQLCWYLNKFV